MGGLHLDVVTSHGSQNLAGSLPRGLGAVETALLVAEPARDLGSGRARARRPRSASCATRPRRSTAFVAFDKVLSPQFMIWLIPLVPLVGGRRGLVASALLGLALLLTQLWFPIRYWDLVLQLKAFPSWAVLARDLALVALLAVLLVRGREPRTASQLSARPSASHSTSAPSIRTPPSAGSNRTGIPVRMRRIASSALTPITESCGPVMPASVIAAVPPGWTRASFVWTCVCVPITAVTRPSSSRARAIFSLVASAWKSTTITFACERASLDEVVDELERADRRLHEEAAHAG